ncbi:MAG: pyruvate kinase [Chloroflexi bacterium]|mgnify:FL=1|nr:pyruvate kinase [Chloroflexota bacterium]|tara:strand:+ start:2610 stop:4061 length:1452 start_codon:yes stop_codon:yes gene_type:complete
MVNMQDRYPFPELPKTKIVCTLGPSTNNPTILTQMIESGMNVARLNMSHGDLVTHKSYVDMVRDISNNLSIPVGLMVDVPGAKYRTGSLKSGGITLKEGNSFVLSSDIFVGNNERVSIIPSGFHKDADVGRTVLVDDGNIELEVLSVKSNDVTCKVVRGGRLTKGRGVVTPGKSPSQVFPDDKAVECLNFASSVDADFVALSNVIDADNIKTARDILKNNNGHNPIIISKIERSEAIDNIASIVEETDAIMVARGDMGVELPLNRVPIIQKDLIRRSNEVGKPVITATQMLESMITSPSPTRAEVTDVANAVYDGSDAVMLSAETSIGQYPLEAVRVMANVALEAEKALPYQFMMNTRHKQLESEVDDAVSFAASQTSNTLDASLIIAFTETGVAAGRVSRYRPKAKILALTPSQKVQNLLTLYWGVFPLVVSKVEDVDDLFTIGEQEARNILNRDPHMVILVAGTPIGVPGTTNMLRILNLN